MWGNTFSPYNRLLAPFQCKLSRALQQPYIAPKAHLRCVTASSAPQECACEVFVSHRGPDVKRQLVSHLVTRLQRVNISVFVDYEIEKGREAWPTILAHLRGAQRVLLLLTPNFEESPWCLEEVRVMAERREAVLPVFVDRQPGDIHEGCLRHSSVISCPDQLDAQVSKAQEWRLALESLSGVAGWEHNSEKQCALPPRIFILLAQVCLLCIALLIYCVHFCSFEAQLVDELTTKLLHEFRPYARLPA